MREEHWSFGQDPIERTDNVGSQKIQSAHEENKFSCFIYRVKASFWQCVGPQVPYLY